MKNYLVVGCGLYGAVFARKLAENNCKVYLIDKRSHIAGNCYTENMEGIPVHKYGPHAFHTNSEKVWNFVNQFAIFNDFKLQVKVNFEGKIYSFPVNLFTLNQLYGITTPSEAKKLLKEVSVNCKPTNFKNFVLNSVGQKIYDVFYHGYTTKQWNKDTSELPASIAKRIPVRFEYNDFYFTDKFQGIPEGGYTTLFEKMLDHKNIKVDLNVDFFENRKSLEKRFDKIIYSGKIDELFDYRFGLLEYRSLKFKFKSLKGTFQGNSIINYNSIDVPYTRIVEHKFFANLQSDRTVISYEYPDDYNSKKIPFYPIETEENLRYFV